MSGPVPHKDEAAVLADLGDIVTALGVLAYDQDPEPIRPPEPERLPVKSYPCPTCGARPGDPCAKRGVPHNARGRQYWIAVREHAKDLASYERKHAAWKKRHRTLADAVDELRSSVDEAADRIVNAINRQTRALALVGLAGQQWGEADRRQRHIDAGRTWLEAFGVPRTDAGEG